MPGETDVRLYRDSLNTPWGFRLYGGKDIGAPLTVQKVSTGTPCDGEVQSGDMILQIQGSDATHLTHLQAQDAIRNAGGSLLLRVRRFGAPIRSPLLLANLPEHRATPPWTPPANQDLGVDYSRGQRIAPSVQPSNQPTKGFMLGRIKDTLSSATEPYPSYQKNWTPAFSFHTPPLPSNPTYNLPAFVPRVEPEQPAWAGSLRSSAGPVASDKHVGPHPHSPQVQTVHYGPGQGPQYKQHAPANYDSDTVRAVHLQYNSPLGLYSKASAQEALDTQLHGKPGEGTIQVLSESDVHRSVLREDNERTTAFGGRGGARHLAPEPADTFVRQSPSLRLLETQVAGGADIGQSDF